jgi:uncharacterized protein YdbL (DUF1318 family)
MRKSMFVTMIAFLVLTLACVTVNVYFPAAEVQDAADQIVGEIRGDQSSPSESGDVPHESRLRRMLLNLPLFERQAYAEADINVTTPNIRALKKSMKDRFASLKALFESGAVGEGNDGLVSVRSLDGLSLKDKAGAKKLVKSENEDRKELYREIAEANDLGPDSASRISKLFANSWRKDSRDGWWVQKDDGSWIRKGSQ